MSEHPTGRLNGGRHPVNIGHLVMGMAFLGLVAVWAIVQSDAVADEHIRWLLPLPWVLAGGAGLVASVLAGRRNHERQVGWVQPEPVEPYQPFPSYETTEPASRPDPDEPLR
jgi:hypothetical protein